MNGNRHLRALWLIPLGILVLAALPAAALGVAGDQAVAPAIQGGNISFAPQGLRAAMTLRVSGGEFVSTQSFHAGQTAWFAPVDREGYQLPDGTYNWEITVAPERRPGRKALARGETPAHGRSASATPALGAQRQSGTFTISNGVMVDPNAVEVRGPRAAAEVALAPQSAAASAAERAGRADNGIAPQRRSARASSVAAPTAAQRAAEINDRDGN